MNAPNPSERRAPDGDRRVAPRYPTGGTPAVIGWSEGDEYRTVAARLIDLSVGGLSAYVEAFPPRGVPVWFRLDGEKPSQWLKAAVITTIKTGCLIWVRRRVRLRFLEACTYDLFKGAIDGFTHEDDHRNQKFEGFDGRYWR
jgi:hypothetical protein